MLIDQSRGVLGMIEDQLIKLDGVEYEWSCRVTDDLPKGKPWSME